MKDLRALINWAQERRGEGSLAANIILAGGRVIAILSAIVFIWLTILGTAWVYSVLGSIPALLAFTLYAASLSALVQTKIERANKRMNK